MSRKKNEYCTFIVSAFLLLTFASPARGEGLVRGLQDIISETRIKVGDKVKKLKSSNKIDYDPTTELLSKSRLSPLFLSSVLLHSNESYISMISSNDCNFYSLLDADMLKYSFGQIDHVLLESNIPDKKEFLVPVKKYLSALYQETCKNNSELSKLFSKESLVETIKKIDINVPNSQKACEEVVNKWKLNPYLPYLCMVPHKIKNARRARKILAKQNLSINQTRRLSLARREGDYLEKNLTFFYRSYLDNLCLSLDRPDNFCAPYIAKDAWSRMVNGELSKDYFSFICGNQDKNGDIVYEGDIRVCASKLKKDNDYCLEKSFKGFPSLYPKNNCRSLSAALNVGRLKTNYKDCPGLVDNDAIINIHRIAQHFDLKLTKIEKSNSKTCYAHAYESLAEIYIQNKDQEVWPLKICYFDKIENKEVCKFYVPGQLTKHPFKEETVIHSILYRLGKVERTTKCGLVSEKKYNPVFMEFKSGCHIIIKDRECTGSSCERKIIVDEKEIKGIKYVGFPLFDYFPLKWTNQRYSMSTIFKERYSLNGKRLENLTQVEIFLKENPKGLIHGMACLEDLLPSHYTRHHFSQCRPIPFIIDGIVNNKDNKYLVTRTTMDDIHHPRLIFWNFIFTGIMNYQKMHPLNSWILYGLTK